MRHQHAGLAIPDFPLAYGKIWPAMDPESVARYNLERVETRAANPITAFQIQLQLAHRLMAVVILLAVCGCAWRAWRRLGRTNPVTKLSVGWAALILSQAILGAATVWSNKAADIATLHVVVGAMSLVTGAMLCLMVYGTASHGAVAAVGSSNLSANRVGVQPSGCSEPGKC